MCGIVALLSNNQLITESSFEVDSKEVDSKGVNSKKVDSKESGSKEVLTVTK